MRGRSVALAVAAAVTVAGGVAAPAAAAPLERGTFGFSDVSTFDECGFDVEVDETLSGWFVIKDATPRTDGQFFRLQQQATYHATFTNVATGEYVTQDWRTTFKEMPATLVSDDGPVVRYRTHETGVWDVFRDSSGTVIARSVGNLVMEYEFDTLGDSAPGGDLVSEEFVRTAGLWQTLDVDFCQALTDAIG
jgi:hypothetical protein